MIRLTVMYPTAGNSTFNWDYYLTKHLELAHQLLDPRGLLKIEIDRGIGNLLPGYPTPYHAIAHLNFATKSDMESAMAATAPELIADQQKYFSGESVLQVSEVVKL